MDREPLAAGIKKHSETAQMFAFNRYLAYNLIMITSLNFHILNVNLSALTNINCQFKVF